MRFPLLFVFFFLFVNRATAVDLHGNGSTDDPSVQPVNPASPPTGVLIMPRAGKPPDKGAGVEDKPPSDGKEKPPQIKGRGKKDEGGKIEVVGQPLFIFADGPNRPGGEVPAVTREETKRLIAEVRRKIPGAQEILTVSPVGVESLAGVWREAKEKKTLETLITSALLVVNAKSELSLTGKFSMVGSDGVTPESGWRTAIEKLSTSLFGAESQVGRGKLETVLLIDNSGLIECDKFPGPVFGGTQAGRTFDKAVLKFWLDRLSGRSMEIFPTTAREWYESWAITDKQTRAQYFYCPERNTRRYLGNKKSSDKYRGKGW